jgi:hypothetical protein
MEEEKIRERKGRLGNGEGERRERKVGDKGKGRGGREYMYM